VQLRRKDKTRAGSSGYEKREKPAEGIARSCSKLETLDTKIKLYTKSVQKGLVYQIFTDAHRYFSNPILSTGQ
jgi:ABC-type Zn2+ transport system substrate-binding protein/surface adhesin